MPANISCTSLTASSFVNTLNFTATGNTTGVDALFTVDVQTPLLRAVAADGYLHLGGGTVGTQILDSAAAVVAELTSTNIALEQDVAVAQTKTLTCASIATTSGVANLAVQGGTQGIVCTSKGLNVTEAFPLSAIPTDGTVAVRVENTAPTGFAALEMSSNGGAGFATLDVAAVGGSTLYAPNQTITLMTVPGSPSFVVNADGTMHHHYSLTGTSDVRLKANVLQTPQAELQAVFDAVEVKCFDRVDVGTHEMGFVADDVEAACTPELAGCLVGSFHSWHLDDQAKTLCYQRMICVLWGAVKGLQARVEALEAA